MFFYVLQVHQREHRGLGIHMKHGYSPEYGIESRLLSPGYGSRFVLSRCDCLLFGAATNALLDYL